MKSTTALPSGLALCLFSLSDLVHAEACADAAQSVAWQRSVGGSVGKALSQVDYGKPSSQAYFSACSDGGRQAVGIAQRYPLHFDGILAAAPAVDIPNMTAYMPLILKTLMAGPKDSKGEPIYPGHAWDPGMAGMNGDTFNSGFRAYWYGTYDVPTNTATKVTLSAPQAALLRKTPPLVQVRGRPRRRAGGEFPAPVRRARHEPLRRRGGDGPLRHAEAAEGLGGRGIAPASVPAEASNPGYFGVASRTRPLCPYPQYAHYSGSGDINAASNFSCRP